MAQDETAVEQRPQRIMDDGCVNDLIYFNYHNHLKQASTVLSESESCAKFL